MDSRKLVDGKEAKKRRSNLFLRDYLGKSRTGIQSGGYKRSVNSSWSVLWLIYCIFVVDRRALESTKSTTSMV